MRVEQLDDRLWRWVTGHPAWVEGDDWPPDVGCVYWESPDAIVLVDPLIPSDVDQRAVFLDALDRDVERAGRPVATLVTCSWHGRSAAELAARYGGQALAPSRASGLEQIDRFEPGDTLPGGVIAVDAGPAAQETVYWLPGARAVVPGDSLIADDAGGVRICPESWLDGPGGPADVARHLAPLLGLPVERVLVSHGEPVRANGLEALREALGPHLVA